MTISTPARVLVVEHDEAEATLLVRSLADAGYTNLVLCRDVKSAIAEIVESPPRLVITELELDGESGTELTRFIRQQESSVHAYVIALTPSGSDAVVGSCFEAGFDDFIEKPFRGRTVIARMHAGERILELETTLRARSHDLDTALRRIEIATTQRSLSHAAEPISSSPASGATPLDALLGTATWLGVEHLLTAAMTDFFQLPFGPVAAQEPSNEPFVAEIALSEPSKQLELGLSVVVETDATKQLGVHLLGDDDLEGAQALVLEVANILMGTLKTAFTAHEMTFTGGIPSTEPFAQLRGTFEAAANRHRMAIGTSGTNLELWLRVKAKRNTTVLGRHLHEGLVVCEDVHDLHGVVLVKGGSRLTHTVVERIARLLPDAEITVSDPSA